MIAVLTTRVLMFGFMFGSFELCVSSLRYGYWFDLEAHPSGPSSTTDICPIGTPLGRFDGNTAHSNGRYGVRIFNFWYPRTFPCASGGAFSYNPPVPANLTNHLSYKNGFSGKEKGLGRCLKIVLQVSPKQQQVVGRVNILDLRT